MKTSRLLPPAFCAALLAVSALFAQGGGIAAEWPARLSGEFAFYRDYTFADPAWAGALLYDEETWAAQVFFPESGKRVTSFFSVKAEGDKLVLTGQRNDPNLQNEDVPFVNYLMQLLPLLWEARRGVEGQGEPPGAKGGGQSILPPEVVLRKDAPLFGGSCEFAFSAELPLFGLKSIKDAGGREVFAFESAGLITADDASAFFSFEPVPQEARQRLFETRKAKGGGGKANEGAEEIIEVAPNFFLVGEAASIVTASGKTGPLGEAAFYAAAAKNFLLSGDADVIPVPGTFECALTEGGVWLDQALYIKEENALMRKRLLLKADFAKGEYALAEISCFESDFAQNKARLERVAASLLLGR